MTLDEVRAVKARHTAGLKALSHVVGVGIGKGDTGFHLTVYLDAPTDAVAASLDGVPVVTHVTGRLTASARPAQEARHERR
jgi:hypothetical protein